MKMGKIIKINSRHNSNAKKIKLHADVDYTKSILYAIGKKRKNNPKKLATIKYSNGDIVEVSIINNFKVKDKSKEYIIDTSKKKINSDSIKFKQINEIFHSNNYSIISQPQLLININDLDTISINAKYFYNIEYTKDSIKKYVDKILALNSSNVYDKAL